MLVSTTDSNKASTGNDGYAKCLLCALLNDGRRSKKKKKKLQLAQLARRKKIISNLKSPSPQVVHSLLPCKRLLQKARKSAAALRSLVFNSG